jgi:phenylpyruvate tautomerase PptA (4-oxalocrotonate tautomerase family)
MPVARISLLRGHSTEFIAAVSEGLHCAMVEAFDVPQADRFHIIHQHDRHEFVIDPHYLCGPRSDGFILIAITAGRPRSPAVKQAFYKRLNERLATSPGIQPEDVMVVISENGAADWSFGRGEATMIRGEYQ